MVQQPIPEPAHQRQSDEPRIQQPTTTVLNRTKDENSEPNCLQNKGLHICHLNIHYLYPKLDEVKILLSNQANIDILCLCETFLNEQFSDDELKIDGFDFIRKDRQAQGGGLIIYFKSYLSCSHRVDLETNDLETIWVEVKNNKQKPFLIGYCYRPPSSTVDWIYKIENTIERTVSDQKEVILLGDFNFNLLNDSSNTKSWLRTVNSLNFQQLINEPTRVTNVSETLIDHIYSNMPENITETKVPHFALSDHYPICFTRKTSSSCPSGPVHKFINYRDTKNFDETLFLQDLDNLTWFMIYEADTATNALDIFVSLFNSVLNKHALKKSRRVKNAVQPNWMNSEILSAM
ncbi:MAG: endonuclease/exonuclease/phosphatase family protein, partial [Candidatus Thiodiazotropha sp.]